MATHAVVPGCHNPTASDMVALCDNMADTDGMVVLERYVPYQTKDVFGTVLNWRVLGIDCTECITDIERWEKHGVMPQSYRRRGW